MCVCATCLDRELAPKEPPQGARGLLPWLGGWTRVRRRSGDLAAVIGWDVAVRLAKGLWTRDWVDIMSTSIRIWPTRSLKSEKTGGGREGEKESQRETRQSERNRQTERERKRSFYNLKAMNSLSSFQHASSDTSTSLPLKHALIHVLNICSRMRLLSRCFPCS